MNLAKFGLGYLNDKGWFASVVSGGLSRNNDKKWFGWYDLDFLIERSEFNVIKSSKVKNEKFMADILNTG